MSAPSFSSFPPSFASFPESEPGPSKSREDDSRPHRNHDKKTRERPKHKDHSKDKSERRKHRKDHRKSLNLDDETSKVQEDLERSKVDEARRFFYIDQRGDPLNITYGGLHSGDVPKYRIFGGGRRILGLSAAWVALHRSGKGVEVGHAGRRKMTSLTDSSTRALLALPPKRSILQAGNGYKHEEVDGFLPLPSRRGGRNPEDTYRSIATKINDSSDESSSESDIAPGSEDSDENDDQSQLPAHQTTSKLLEQELSANPTSVTTWLSLLSHNLSTIPIASKNATKARSEISCSILSRAIAASPQNAASKVLRLKYLKSGEEIWHESKLRAEWDVAFKAGGIDIWMEWLEWRIRKGNTGLEGILEDAAKVLQVLGSDDESEVGRVRVLWRVAVALHSAGYTERATAMFQAQAELTFKLPQVLKGLSFHAQVDQLEEFWESEVPRIGEVGAKGWSAWVASGRADEATQPQPADPPQKSLPNSDPYTIWALNELHADRTARLPARSKDESEDPYATILFSDIRTMLSSLRTQRAQHLFRLAWISFIGLHVPGFSASQDHDDWDDRWSHGHLCAPAFLDALFPNSVRQKHIMADAIAGVVVGREKEYQDGFGPVRNWGRGVFGPFDAGIYPTNAKGKEVRGFWGRETLKTVDQELVKRIFKQLRLGREDFEWDGLALAFEFALNMKGALKLARTLLADSPDSPLHWGMHAQLERVRNNILDARKVYQTILPPSPEPAARNRMGEIWWEWAQLEWLCGRPDEALDVILRSAGVAGHTGIVILRGKRQLEDAIKSAEGGEKWKEREAWVKLRALLELLTTGDIAAALSVFDDHLQGEVQTLEHESMIVACLLMIQHHSIELRNPTPPDILRARVERALEQYPSHSLILGLFLEGEKGQGVWGRVRGMLGESGGKTKDVARRAEEVWIARWETGRWESEIERTRGGLIAAVEHERQVPLKFARRVAHIFLKYRTRASPIIWRIYLEFEIRAGEFQRAKKIFFRAIGECPLNKELYLLAFTALREVFSRQELNALSDTMVERGIRVRHELEAETDVERMQVGDEEGMDEIEENASELRRLMPY
ncbi:NRDE-2, necessary for RNA interference-domain-containing protein [Infundibulicybe gibba]|nr:NRDE-2, necessary for RNA interference-domain-containing protein [Infundibulicybe gibba]